MAVLCVCGLVATPVALIYDRQVGGFVPSNTAVFTDERQD